LHFRSREYEEIERPLLYLQRVKLSLLTIIAGFLLVAVALPASSEPEEFSHWLKEFTNEARERGISQQSIDAAFEGVQPLPRVIELDRSQPERVDDLCSYLASRLTESRIERARKMHGKHWSLLNRVYEKYGVPPRYVAALWALESNFGTNQGRYKVIDALATLAHDERRGSLFRKQLLAALRIVEEGHQKPSAMYGSWAGAMGQVQFMPTTFISYAVDYDGDGRKDIWSSLPDAFASAANYLKKAGWRSGESWGREVLVPLQLRSDRSKLSERKTLAQWRGLGVKRASGRALPHASMSGSIVMPTPDSDYAFLVYDNYRTILRWNNSNLFAISVGALADEISSRASLRVCQQ
jgi:membrane-bound lytic murein transglycosylase B